VQIHSFGADLAETTRETLDLIESAVEARESAVEAREKVTFAYVSEAGAESRRVVRPLGLWFWGKVWTCVAWCELRGDFRTFRVDRMDKLERGPRYKPERGQTLRDFYGNPDSIGATLQTR